MKFLIASALILSASVASAAQGGSHSGQPVDSFVTSQSIAGDASSFSVADLKKIKVPTTSTTTGQPCLASDEYAQNCEQTHYADYVDAYRLTVAYVSPSTKLASDEYPQGDDWTTDFVFPADSIDTGLATTALTAHGKDKKLALQRLVSQFNIVLVASQGSVITHDCEYNIVGETEWVKVDPSCQEQYGSVTVQNPYLQLELAH